MAQISTLDLVVLTHIPRQLIIKDIKKEEKRWEGTENKIRRKA